MRFLLFFTLLYTVAACQNDTRSKQLDKIAGTYCECTLRLAELNRDAASFASDTLSDGRFAVYLQQIQEEYDNAKNCTASIIAQNGRLRPTALDSVRALLATKCPELVEQRDLLQEMLGE